MNRNRPWIAAFLLLGALRAHAAEAAARPAAELYVSMCSGCHDGTVPRAPHKIVFLTLGPQRVFMALKDGVMRAQGAALSLEEKKLLAEYLGQAKLGEQHTSPLVRCAADDFDLRKPPALDGWGLTREGTRYIDSRTAALAPQDLPSLKLKWAFAFPGASHARAQPMVAGNHVFVGSEDGTVYSLSMVDGCVQWTFRADAEVRNSVSVEPWSVPKPHAHPRLFFGDLHGNAYALDARSGRLLWKRRVDEHPYAQITGAPRLYQNRLYVPVSSTEWSAAGNLSYGCCTFRGGVVALETSSGRIAWHAFSIAQPPTALIAAGATAVTHFAPAGAPIWNTPTIDEKRQRLYVGTGESYTSPAAPESDAVLAIDLATGHTVWSYQSTPHDAWNLGCFVKGSSNCPQENGPDLDIGASPILFTSASGRQFIFAGQKSGHVFALDPDAQGKVLWRNKYGRGGFDGGVHFGLAASPTTLFAPMTDDSYGAKQPGIAKPGLFALQPETGKIKWFAPALNTCAEDKVPSCDPGFSAPPTAVAGMVFQPSYDGWLRAYDERTGTLLWSTDTTLEVKTVSGDMAHGGSIDSVGAVVIEGHVLISSGYVFGRMPGNVLLVYSARP